MSERLPSDGQVANWWTTCWALPASPRARSHCRLPRHLAKPVDLELVDQNSASWNRIADWLGQLDLIRSAA